MNWYMKVLQNYAGFEGRSRRKEFWMFLLFNMLISYGLQIIAVVADKPVLMFLYVLYTLGVLIPSIAVGVRRMHDVGKSGWFFIVPIYNFYLAIEDGDLLENQYGSNPKIEVETILQKV